MKKLTLLITLILFGITVFAQVPHAFKYQAVARDNTGNILDSINVSFRISIVEGSTSGVTVYTETQDTITNSQGLVNLEIGNGTVISGIFEDIEWGDGPFYLQIEMDDSGGNAYELLGVSQILSVPISLHSKTADISKGLVLTDQYGQEHTLSLDPEGNIVADLIMECGDTIIDIRDGQQYVTVLIGSQCWMAENLNLGMRIDGIIEQTDNDTIEKYCSNDLEINCDAYGGLYQWNEMMEYMTSPGTQGICMDGWHIPTDYEWKILEGTVDSHFGIGDNEWNSTFARGNDAGLNLKSINGWNDGGNGTDLYGFTALPAGSRYTGGSFSDPGYFACLWSSNESGYPYIWMRNLNWLTNLVDRNTITISNGYSIRCIKDYTNQPPIQPENPIPGDGTIDIGIDTVLSWSCSDPDGNDLFYKIHFGNDPNPSYDTAGITDTIYDPGILDYSTTYYWKVVVFDSYGDSAVSNIWSFTTTLAPFICGDVLVDARDGQSYNTVLIGTQCWLAENLNIGTRIDGIDNQIQNSPTEIIEKYCYDDLESNCDTYGGLYQWDEMMQYITTEGTQGLCPEGWHIPTDNNWNTLVVYLGGTEVAGGKLKEDGITHWQSPNPANNESGFTALPGGRNAGGSFLGLGTLAYFYTSSEVSLDRAWYWLLGHVVASTDHYDADKGGGFSVRCLMD